MPAGPNAKTPFNAPPGCFVHLLRGGSSLSVRAICFGRVLAADLVDEVDNDVVLLYTLAVEVLAECPCEIVFV